MKRSTSPFFFSFLESFSCFTLLFPSLFLPTFIRLYSFYQIRGRYYSTSSLWSKGLLEPVQTAKRKINHSFLFLSPPFRVFYDTKKFEDGRRKKKPFGSNLVTFQKEKFLVHIVWGGIICKLDVFWRAWEETHTRIHKGYYISGYSRQRSINNAILCVYTREHMDRLELFST